MGQFEGAHGLGGRGLRLLLARRRRIARLLVLALAALAAAAGLRTGEVDGRFLPFDAEVGAELEHGRRRRRGRGRGRGRLIEGVQEGQHRVHVVVEASL